MTSKSKRYCSVPQCNTYHDSKVVSLHYFPKDEKLKKLWQSRLKIGKPVTQYMNVCSKHFLREDFITSLGSSKPKLKCAASPSQNLPTTSHSRVSSNTRRKKHQKPKQSPKVLNSFIAANVESVPDDVTFVKVEPNQHFEENIDKPTSSNPIFVKKTPSRMTHTIHMNIPMEPLTAPPSSLKQGPSRFKIKIVKKQLTKKDVSGMFDYTETNSYMLANRHLKTISGISLPFLSKLIQATKSDPRILKNLDLKDVLLLFLVKMKSRISLTALSTIFQINPASTHQIFFENLDLLAASTSDWLSHAHSQSSSDPSSWSKYKVIDCIEIITECPRDETQAKSMFSRSKHHSFLFWIGMASDGAIFYVSKSCPGGFSGERSAGKLDFLNFVQSGDVVATRRIFPDFRMAIEGRGAALVSLAFREAGQGDRCFQIATLRRQYERTLQRLRSFEVLDPVTAPFFNKIDELVHMGCILANHTI